MVGRFQDVYNNDMDVGDLPAEEQVYHGCLSPEHADDYSSDEEMRTEDKKNLTVKRLYAEKHKS